MTEDELFIRIAGVASKIVVNILKQSFVTSGMTPRK